MSFTNLPKEIIICIAEDHLSDASDVFSLVLTCQMFANVLAASFERHAFTKKYVKRAICVAAAHRKEDKLKVLVQKARELNALDFIGDCPKCSDQGIVQFIMDQGANLAILDFYRSGHGHPSTLLHFAVWSLYAGTVEALLVKGANTEALGLDYLTTLQLANSLKRIPLNRQNEIVRLLLEHGANADAESRWGIAPIAQAVSIGNAYQVRLMSPKNLSRRFRISSANERWRLLDLAVDRGDIDIARALIEKGADPNMPNDIGTPLHYAARGGHLELAKLLLDKGALIDTRGSFARTPLHLAISSGQEIVNLLLDRGASINLVDSNGLTALHSLVKGPGLPDSQLVRLLVERGADPTIQDNDGETALHYAAQKGCKATTELLLAYGADTSVINRTGQTALHHAARFSAVTTEILLAAGAVVDARDINGKTPLHHVSEDAKRAAHLLVEWGADVTAKDLAGVSIPDWVLNETHPQTGKGEDEVKGET